MTVTDRPAHHADEEPPRERRSGELTARELLRWGWRQLTSMRTALILLLLLALAAIPGSLIPQQGADALRTSNWKDAHPTLTPIYERLQLFSVYESAWFAAIYLLLMVSLVGCIVPRCLVYARALRAQPPAAPRNLSRLPDHTTVTLPGEPAAVLAEARTVLRKRRYRVREDAGDGTVAAERGYLREAGNLLFHLSVLIVLVGFAVGGLFGYKGGSIILVGGGFSNNVTQYDDFDPGSLFDPQWMEPFSFTIDDFSAEWLTDGPRAGMARNFRSELSYQTAPDAPEQRYDLRVNHPLKIGDTDVFLIGHGYAPVLTVRDGEGEEVKGGPTVFLPLDTSFQSVGVVKAPTGTEDGIGLEGEFYPTWAMGEELPYSAFGNALDPRVSMIVYAGDLNQASSQSVYQLDKRGLRMLTTDRGTPYRIDLALGESVTLPDGLGTVSFDGLQRWNKLQISRTPGATTALVGVSLALLGLLGSLFIRPRRVWVRVRRGPDGQGSEVELAGLDRSGGGDVAAELATIRTGLAPPPRSDSGPPAASGRMSLVEEAGHGRLETEDRPQEERT